MEELLDKINMAIKGDKDAYSRIISYYERQLYVIAKSRLNNNEDIKDVMQETIMQGYIKINGLKSAEKFSSWITSILINNCNKLYIKNKMKLLSYDDIEETNNINFKQENEYKKVEDDINFLDIINFLNIEDKTIISMYYLNEYTTKEISEILKINESTIRSRISNIRNKIKDKMGKENI